MNKSDKLYGVGLDSDRNGDKYITRAEGFEIYGGSKDTHDKMREIATRFDEGLKKDGKELRDCKIHEVAERLVEATEKTI